MGRVDSPALKGTRLGRLLGAWNPIMKRILTSPLHWPLSRWFALIEWTGRKSGKRYSTPVAYLARDSETWITTGDRWWHNLGERPRVRIWLKGAPHDGLAEPVLDRAESVRLHSLLFEAKPFFARLAGLPARPTASEIERSVGAGRVLVRVSVAVDTSVPSDAPVTLDKA
jgi:deazaflavin-dependent oxidoreductase (nitroreductase family)